jgi:hypothetical protein
LKKQPFRQGQTIYEMASSWLGFVNWPIGSFDEAGIGGSTSPGSIWKLTSQKQELLRDALQGILT